MLKKSLRALFLGSAAVVCAAVVSLVASGLFVALPAGAEIAINGVKSVSDSPGHGAAFLFLTVPLAMVVLPSVFFLLTVSFYEGLSRRLDEIGEEKIISLNLDEAKVIRYIL